MKHGRKPTVKQCKLMESYGLDPAEWLVVKNTPDEMWVVERRTGHVQRLYKGANG